MIRTEAWYKEAYSKDKDVEKKLKDLEDKVEDLEDFRQDSEKRKDKALTHLDRIEREFRYLVQDLKR